MQFSFSREIRLGEVVSALLVVGGLVGVYTTTRSDLDQLKGAQAIQSVTNRELREEIRNVAGEIKTDIRDLRQEVRETRAARVQVVPRSAM